MKKTTLFSISIVALLTTLLSSCATMSTKECQAANWRTVGYADATKGKPVRLSGHTEACAKVKIRPNHSLYMSGYNQGAREFCTYQSGMRFGKKGKSANNICTTPALGNKFFRGYNKGKQIYDIDKEIDKKRSERRDVDKKIKNINKTKVKSSIHRLNLLYREKELINREINSLQREKDRIAY